MNRSLLDKIEGRQGGICLYGIAPPKLATAPDQLAAIVAQQQARLQSLEVDGLVIYDIQDEPGRSSAPRPFPFLPTIDPEAYASDQLGSLALPKIVYRSVGRDTPATFRRWLERTSLSSKPQISVLVGAPHRHAEVSLSLAHAYDVVRQHAPHLMLGGIAIAERHLRHLDEHQRMLAKSNSGCRFFVTQAVYDVTSTKSLLSDYALALRERGEPALPVILTFSPCGSHKTLELMKWLGVSIPRWLDNELRHAADPLATSVRLCESIFAEVWDYARDKGIPLGVNVESVSIRKAEIEASIELLRSLQNKIRE